MRLKKTLLCMLIADLIVLGSLLAGSKSQQALSQSKTLASAMQGEKIGVTPFFKGRHGSSLRETFNCPISQLYFNPENVSTGSDKILTDYVQGALQKRHGERVIPLSDVTTVFKRIPKNETEDTPRNLAQKTGHALGASLIIVGTVWRFKERVGGAMGVESPASVAFAISLIDVASGKMLWNAAFDKTQRSLSEDIRDARAFFKKGAKWLTASELAHYGIKEIFKKFPL